MIQRCEWYANAFTVSLALVLARIHARRGLRLLLGQDVLRDAGSMKSRRGTANRSPWPGSCAQRASFGCASQRSEQSSIRFTSPPAGTTFSLTHRCAIHGSRTRMAGKTTLASCFSHARRSPWFASGQKTSNVGGLRHETAGSMRPGVRASWTAQRKRSASDLYGES